MNTTGAEAAFPHPPHLTDPTGTLGVWFTEPAGALVQFQRHAHGTVHVAEWLAGPARDAVLARFPEASPLVIVLDLSKMSGRDPVVRKVLMEGLRSLAARIGRAVVVPPEGANRVYLASLHAAASLARVFGVDASVKTLPAAVAGLRPAASGSARTTA